MEVRGRHGLRAEVNRTQIIEWGSVEAMKWKIGDNGANMVALFHSLSLKYIGFIGQLLERGF